jgi:hypothetical protein
MAKFERVASEEQWLESFYKKICDQCKGRSLDLTEEEWGYLEAGFKMKLENLRASIAQRNYAEVYRRGWK